jgi:DNA transposition AAA+ family ATPase
MSEVTTPKKTGSEAATPLPVAINNGNNASSASATIAASTVSKSLAAEASSAHARINIPLNLDNWKHLTHEAQSELCWLHQHFLDNAIGWDDATKAMRYDRTTVFRVLKGTYEGSWTNVCDRIRDYRELVERRGTIQHQEFATNSISRMIWAGLDYALSNGSITTIVGESRMGKTISLRQWAKNNSGRAVLVTVLPLGGAKGLVRAVAAAVGVNKSQATAPLIEAVYRAFNPNRILVVDEAHRCMPNDMRTVNPAAIEFLRDLHDQTGAALALVSTQRMTSAMRKGAYQYEQLVGRIGMPILLKPKIKRADIYPIVQQFVPEPSVTLMDELDRIANTPGRLGILVETLRVASRMANKAGATLDSETVLKAIALRRQMSGEEV